MNDDINELTTKNLGSNKFKLFFYILLFVFLFSIIALYVKYECIRANT